MAEQPLDELIQSVGRSLSRANRDLGRGEDGRQYAVSELTVSSPLSRLTVDDDVLVDTDLGDDESPGNRYVEFTVVPLPEPEEEMPEEEVPNVKDRPVSRAVETLLARGYTTDRIQLAFDPDSDATAGRIASYELRERAGAGRDEVLLTVAGEPPAENRLGAIATDEVSDADTDEESRLYRRRETSDAWHFCRNCSNYPAENYLTSEKRPTYGELCDECQAKEKRGDCE